LAATILCCCADEDFEAAKEAVEDMKTSYESLRDKCSAEELPDLEKIVRPRHHATRHCDH
jgi:hypothetical protein